MRFQPFALATLLVAALPLSAHPRVFLHAGFPSPRPRVVVRPALPVFAPPVVVVGHRPHLGWCRRHHRRHHWHRGCW
ncbi:MAG: hypothetical protein U0P81_07280 [Holophagaceae bacterium]